MKNVTKKRLTLKEKIRYSAQEKRGETVTDPRWLKLKETENEKSDD